MKKLLRQIRREAARSPQKAAVLGLLALVAVWFWSPLLLGWVRGNGQEKANAATANTSPLDLELATARSPMAGTKAPTRPPEGPAANGNWQEVIARLEADPLTDAVVVLTSTRDPFTPVDLPPPQKSPAEEAEARSLEAEKNPEPSPADVGLTLTSTLVGPGGALALVGGKAYRPQDKIAATYASKKIEFTLAEVHPRRAVLLREGKSYDLRIPRPDGSDRDEQGSGE